MKIVFNSDTICPWCFIGKRRLEAALAMRPGLSADIEWKPFQLNPTIPAGGMERHAYLTAKFGGADRAERSYARIRAAGREAGIRFRFDRIRRTPNTIDSHRLILRSRAAGCQATVVENLFRAFFIDGRDLGDLDTLADIGGESGLDRADTRAYLSGGDDRSRIVAEDEENRRNGITGVPCIVIEGKYAVSGAQSPEIFVQIFDLVRQDARENPELHTSAAE